MPFNRPIPESKPPAKATGGFGALVEAEKLMQIAFVLPSAVVVGWLGGALADHLLHTKWMVIAGIGLGCVSGLYYVIQSAFAAEKASRKEETIQNGTEKDNAGNP
jgi:F0F1-type ATP synthase assembly protein I